MTNPCHECGNKVIEEKRRVEKEKKKEKTRRKESSESQAVCQRVRRAENKEAFVVSTFWPV